MDNFTHSQMSHNLERRDLTIAFNLCLLVTHLSEFSGKMSQLHAKYRCFNIPVKTLNTLYQKTDGVLESVSLES